MRTEEGGEFLAISPPMYVVLQVGVYRHDIHGPFMSEHHAKEKARKLASEDYDSWHDYEVHQLKAPGILSGAEAPYRFNKVATKHQIRSKLAWLERLGSPKAIARWLEEKGYKGRRLSPSGCPLARYLKTSVGAHTYMAPGTGESIRLTPRVHGFRRLFDAGKYPFLER